MHKDLAPLAAVWQHLPDAVKAGIVVMPSAAANE